MQKKIRKIVIPVAGFGTRFLPATKAAPKEMLPLVDKPVVQLIVEEAKESGIEEVIFITSSNKRAIEDHFDSNAELEAVLKKKGKTKELEEINQIHQGVRFVYTRQGEAKGLGHAIWCAKDIVGDEPFIVCGGDDVITAKPPAIKQMIETYERYNDPVLAVFEVEKENVGRYGVIDPKIEVSEGVYEIKGIVEKPNPSEAPSNYISAARWLLTPDIFELLEKVKPSKKDGEIQLQDALAELLESRPIYAKLIEGTYFDCGNKLEYLKAVVDYGLHKKELQKEFKEYLKTLQL